jgi:O-antigen ligase
MSSFENGSTVDVDLSRQQYESAPRVVTLSTLKAFEKIALFLVMLLIFTSLVAALPQMINLFQGRRISGALTETGGFGLRLLREGTWFLIVLFIVFSMVYRPRLAALERKSILLFYLILLWSFIIFVISLAYRELPFTLIFAGLRIFQYTPLVLLGYWLTKQHSHSVVIYLAKWLRYYVLVQAAVSLFQFITDAGQSWSQTVFGARVFGTFVYYNQFGTAMGVAGLCFLLASISHKQLFGSPRFLGWLYLTILLSLLSGSRTSLIISCLNLFYLFMQRFRPGSDRTIIALMLPLLLPVLLFSISNRQLTGRDIDLAEEGRLSIWQDILRQVNSVPDVVFGLGLGLGSNTSVTVFGEDAFAGQIGNTHNVYLLIWSAFGVVGLILYLVLLIMTLSRGSRHHAPIFVLFLFVLGIPYSFWEFFPSNALLMFLWGCLAGIGWLEQLPGRATVTTDGTPVTNTVPTSP